MPHDEHEAVFTPHEETKEIARRQLLERHAARVKAVKEEEYRPGNLHSKIPGVHF